MALTNGQQPGSERREAAVVMAAGKGTRMRSDLPKVCHQAAGKALVQWVVEACREAGIGRVVVVVGYQADKVREALAGYDVEFAVQTEQLGTGHAAAQAHAALGDGQGLVFVLNGDGPLITAEVLRRMRDEHRAAGADAAILSAVPDTPLEYGRVIRKPSGDVEDVVEERDCTPEQRAIRELNMGCYVFNAPDIWRVLGSLSNQNNAGEYYITDVPRHYARQGGKVIAVQAPAEVGLGVNTPEQLRQVEQILIGRGRS